MKLYSIKEIFYSIQGEGHHAGQPAVFIRFSGCNLWSGREEDRSTAICRFCDTDFIGGTKMAAKEIADNARSIWPGDKPGWCVLTGGEPALQVDRELVGAIRARGFRDAIETNGTIKLGLRHDWVTLSPKAGTTIRQPFCDELKVVYPQNGLDLDSLKSIATIRRYLQPMDGKNIEQNRNLAMKYSLANPEWSLSLQINKILGIR